MQSLIPKIAGSKISLPRPKLNYPWHSGLYVMVAVATIGSQPIGNQLCATQPENLFRKNTPQDTRLVHTHTIDQENSVGGRASGERGSQERFLSFQLSSVKPVDVTAWQHQKRPSQPKNGMPTIAPIAVHWQHGYLMRSQYIDANTSQKSKPLRALSEELTIPGPAELEDSSPANKVKEIEAILESDSADLSGIDCYTTAPLSTITVDIGLPSGKLPTNAFEICKDKIPPIEDPRTASGWMIFDYHWSATHMQHRPLYFEELNAERYGYTSSYFFQPAISAGRFFATIPALPYRMAVNCPCDCNYTLGHYRPGSCNPWRWHRWPLKLSASAIEVGFAAGMILILP